MSVARVLKRAGIYLVLAHVCLASGLVLAQDASPPEPEETTTGGDPNDSDLTASQMVDEASARISKMQEVLNRVMKLQEEADHEKDMIRLNCINPSLRDLSQIVNIAEAARTRLSEAIAKNDDEARFGEYSTITMASDRATELGDEADACVSGEEDLGGVGGTAGGPQATVEMPANPEVYEDLDNAVDPGGGGDFGGGDNGGGGGGGNDDQGEDDNGQGGDLMDDPPTDPPPDSPDT